MRWAVCPTIRPGPAVSVMPAWAVPVIVGRDVFVGGDGRALTVSVGADVAVLEPPVLEAVTATRNVAPTSSAVAVYGCPVAESAMVGGDVLAGVVEAPATTPVGAETADASPAELLGDSGEDREADVGGDERVTAASRVRDVRAVTAAGVAAPPLVGVGDRLCSIPVGGGPP
jgi:hypothetical protein